MKKIKALTKILEHADAIEPKSVEEWLAERRKGVGASEASTIAGLNPYRSIFSLWAEKVGVEDPPLETEPMKWGKKLEPVIASAFQEETSLPVISIGEVTILRSKAVPWQQATLDRLVIDGRKAVPLEIKTTSERNASQWDEGAPPWYRLQVQHQLAVTGAPYAFIVVLIGGQRLRHEKIERDPEAIAQLSALEFTFWKLVLKKTPPEIDGSEQAAEILRRMRNPTKERIMLSAEVDEWDRERQEMKETIAIAERKERELRNRIMQSIGDGEAGITPSGTRFEIHVIEKKPYTVTPKPYLALLRKE